MTQYAVVRTDLESDKRYVVLKRGDNFQHDSWKKQSRHVGVDQIYKCLHDTVEDARGFIDHFSKEMKVGKKHFKVVGVELTTTVFDVVTDHFVTAQPVNYKPVKLSELTSHATKDDSSARAEQMSEGLKVLQNATDVTLQGKTLKDLMEQQRKPYVQRVSMIVSEMLGIPLAEVPHDATLVSLGGDSLDAVEILMAVEDEFGIEITDEDGEKCSTLTDLAVLAQRLKEANANKSLGWTFAQPIFAK